MTIQEQIAIFVAESLEGTDCFLIDFKLKPTNNYKIYIDSDTGFTLEKAVSINRKIRKKVDEAGLYPEGDYSLEVSSPGVDSPLKLHRQYLKNIGRKLEIELTDEEAGGVTGKLIAVHDDHIVVAESLPKRRRVTAKADAEPKLSSIAFDTIKTAVVCLEF